MKLSNLVLLCVSVFPATSIMAFSPGMGRDLLMNNCRYSNNNSKKQDGSRLGMAEDGGDKDELVYNKPPTESGTHDELMYALGVNLARQLGDVRPLVENGQELSLVAKGLLDSLVGRFTEEGQVELLSSRQKDLNELIIDRS